MISSTLDLCVVFVDGSMWTDGPLPSPVTHCVEFKRLRLTVGLENETYIREDGRFVCRRVLVNRYSNIPSEKKNDANSEVRCGI